MVLGKNLQKTFALNNFWPDIFLSITLGIVPPKIKMFRFSLETVPALVYLSCSGCEWWLQRFRCFNFCIFCCWCCTCWWSCCSSFSLRVSCCSCVWCCCWLNCCCSRLTCCCTSSCRVSSCCCCVGIRVHFDVAPLVQPRCQPSLYIWRTSCDIFSYHH